MTIQSLHRIAAALTCALAFMLLTPTGASAVGPGKTCGGIAGIQCDAGLFCQNPAGRCKVADISGKCVKVPEICNKIYLPVCGCDGRTYGNDCERQMAKVSRAHNGSCKKM